LLGGREVKGLIEKGSGRKRDELTVHKMLEKKGVVESISVVMVIVVWHLVALAVGEPFKLPSPPSVLFAFYRVSDVLLKDILVSFLHFGIGIGMGAAVGITIGAVMGWFKLLERSVDPVVEVTRAIPPLAWIPFAIAWLGCTHQAPGFIVFVGAVFRILLNTYAGFRSVDRSYIDVARVFGCKTNTSLIKFVALPYSLPFIATGLRVGMGVGWMCVVAAEMLGASNNGLGFRLWQFYGLHMMDKVVAYMLVIGILAMLIDRIFRGFVDTRLLHWRKGLTKLEGANM